MLSRIIIGFFRRVTEWLPTARRSEELGHGHGSMSMRWCDAHPSARRDRICLSSAVCCLVFFICVLYSAHWLSQPVHDQPGAARRLRSSILRDPLAVHFSMSDAPVPFNFVPPAPSEISNRMCQDTASPSFTSVTLVRNREVNAQPRPEEEDIYSVQVVIQCEMDAWVQWGRANEKGKLSHKVALLTRAVVRVALLSVRFHAQQNWTGDAILLPQETELVVSWCMVSNSTKKHNVFWRSVRRRKAVEKAAKSADQLSVGGMYGHVPLSIHYTRGFKSLQMSDFLI